MERRKRLYTRFRGDWGNPQPRKSKGEQRSASKGSLLEGKPDARIAALPSSNKEVWGGKKKKSMGA